MTKWCANRAFDTPAYNCAKTGLEHCIFLQEGSANHGAMVQAWEISNRLEKLQVEYEIIFLCEAAEGHEDYDSTQ